MGLLILFKPVFIRLLMALHVPLLACAPTGQGNAATPSPSPLLSSSPSAIASTPPTPPVATPTPTASLFVNPSTTPVNTPSPSPQASATPVPALFEVELGKAFDLPMGKIAQLKNTDLALSWISPAQDSRCPSDVNCVWAGEVKVTVMVKNGQNSQSLILQLPGKESLLVSADMGGYLLTLNDVKPYPQTKTPSKETPSLNLLLSQPKQN
jgi:hypothetical protein